MLVTSKSGTNATVERGYLNTEIIDHQVGSSVRSIPRHTDNDIKSSFAFATIRSETGLRYQIKLGPELSLNSLSTDGCPNAYIHLRK